MGTMPFVITQRYTGLDMGTKTMRISGFTEQEIDELIRMGRNDMTEKVLEMLDDRNGNLGTCWHNGYGVYGCGVDLAVPGSVLMIIGSNAD